MRCPACGAETPDTRADCAACGADLLDFEQTAHIDIGGDGLSGGAIFANRYVIERRIGRGAMGVVLLARDTKLGQRPVALKLLPFDLAASKRARRALRREAEKAARLTHPGIVRVYDYDEHQGQLYVSMEYIEGRSMQQAIDDDDLPLATVIRTGQDLARALAYAHSQGVLHRDVKPANVFLSKSGEVKLGDFGISREADTQATRTGTRLSSSGTPAYMAPEAIQGVGEDERSDEYSLGCTLYALATGSPPFTIGDVSYQHVHSDPPPPSSKRAGLSKQFDTVVMRCLAKRPQDRFPSTADVADALVGKPVPAVSGATSKPPRRRSGGAIVLLGVLAMLALVVGSVGMANGWFDQWLHPRPEPPPRTEPVTEPAEDAPTEPNDEPPVEAPVDPPADPPPQDPDPPPADPPKNPPTGLVTGLTPDKREPVVPERTDFLLQVTSDPPGATVAVEGSVRGMTPLPITLAMAGSQTIRVTKEYYEPFETKAVDPGGDGRGALPVVLVRSTGVLSLEGGAPRASVALERDGTPPKRYSFTLDGDGRLADQEVEAGRYSVRSKVPGFGPCEMMVTIVGGGQPALDLGMAQRGGTLSIDSNPQGAAVRVDGRTVGHTPLLDHPLPPGGHSVELVLDGFEAPAPVQVRIRGEKNTDLGIRSLVAWPVVDLNALLPGTVVRIDGREYRGGESVAPGDHNVELAREGFSAQTDRRTAVAGRPFTIRADDWKKYQAVLDLNTLRPGESATIDGRAVTGLIPYSEAVEVIVLVTRIDHERQEIRVQLELGRTSPLRVGEWKPVAGSIDLSGLPPGATVELDGSVLEDGARLEPGDYHVTLHRPGFKSQPARFSVVPGRAARVAASAAWEPADITAAGVREILGDLVLWDAAGSPSRRRAAEHVAARESAFTFVDLRTFASGGVSHEMALFTHTKTGLEFVLIPGGSFYMGSRLAESVRRDDEVGHDVTLTQPFLLARTECTQKAWTHVSGRAFRTEFQGDDLPLESVSWEQAAEFCTGVGLRLPTEAEWEYACRAGTTTAYSFGDDPAALPDQVWYSRNTRKATQPVGGKPPNAFGLLDMLGNVQEWCADWYAPELPAEPQVDPSGPEDTGKRVARGGSLRHKEADVRSASRQSSPPARDRWDLGFRPAYTVRP